MREALSRRFGRPWRPWVKSTLLTAAPLALLALDACRSPIFFETSFQGETLRIDQLLIDSSVEVGSIRGHRIHLLMGTLDDLRYLERMEEGSAALVLSLYQGAETPRVGAGTSARAVLDLLASHAARDHRKFVDRIVETSQYPPGSVLSFKLDDPISRGSAEIDRILAVRVNAGRSETPGALRRGMFEVFRRADKAAVDSLVIPCLMVTWKSTNSVSFDDYFQNLFEAMEAVRRPRNVYIFFYRGWPTWTLEQAVSSFNAFWTSRQLQERGLPVRIYNFHFRLMTFAAAILLLVGTRIIPDLSWKKTLLLLGSFIGAVLGLFELVERVWPDLGEGDLAIVKLLVTVPVAILLPLLAYKS